ncbi:hypothetical protein CPSG_03154 [Coccidioides posadasii str. Silveira]|uniref:Uncharacterized protein n=1 Tax=Coccidioides posadasii (strain RMSCC 757 / Silveira) TaxID=443226 RepID=E9D0X5_COCPS|nr:hypothetical protein CPSG_03154 [Coccidioides posadasii str. Silveira]
MIVLRSTYRKCTPCPSFRMDLCQHSNPVAYLRTNDSVLAFNLAICMHVVRSQYSVRTKYIQCPVWRVSQLERVCCRVDSSCHHAAVHAVESATPFKEVKPGPLCSEIEGIRLFKINARVDSCTPCGVLRMRSFGHTFKE